MSAVSSTKLEVVKKEEAKEVQDDDHDAGEEEDKVRKIFSGLNIESP